MKIEQWLKQFRAGWMHHDVPKVMQLFTVDCEYWETPFRALHSAEEVRREWQAIHKQHNIEVVTSILFSSENTHAINWSLIYDTDERSNRELAGLYIVRLDRLGRCEYFYQVGESKN